LFINIAGLSFAHTLTNLEKTMIETRTAPYAALILRLALGGMFLSHGLLKLLVFTPAGTAGFFASLGLPGWLGYATMAAEITGGVLLIAGVQTRKVSLILIPVLLGALWVHSGNGWLFSSANGGWEYPLFLSLSAAAQALLGDGAYSLSALLGQKKISYSNTQSVA
jgi:putative oxidoreductase